MNKTKTIVVASALAIGLAGCAGAGPNQQAGAGIGAAGGAIAGALIANNSGGNALVGALIGGVAGGIIGGAIGAALDERERAALAAAQRRAAQARTGQRINWSTTNNQGQRTTGWVVPGNSYQTASGQECRPLQRGLVKGGQTRTDSVTQCRTASGWSVPAA